MKLKLFIIVLGSMFITGSIYAAEPMTGFGTIDLLNHEGKGHTQSKHIGLSKNDLEQRVPITNQSQITDWEKYCSKDTQDVKSRKKLGKPKGKFGKFTISSKDEVKFDCTKPIKPECNKTTPMTSFKSLDSANSIVNTVINHPLNGITSCVGYPTTIQGNCKLVHTVSNTDNYGIIRTESCDIKPLTYKDLTTVTVILKSYTLNNKPSWFVLTAFPSK